MEITGETLDVLLDALAEQLRSLGVQLEIVVIGGSALTALGLVKRATRDVDLVAIAKNGELLLKSGLPAGFLARVVTRRYGQVLAVHFAGRVDQIHFKLFAMVDQAGGRHETDLRALHPTTEELVVAARWSMTQDPSPGYRMVLLDALSTLGVEDADLGA
jgi:Nucleotidyltransferase of unknown function (DUF6036)